MYEQISRNKRDSVLLVGAMAALLLTLGYVIARAWGMPGWMGLAIAGGTSVILFVVSWYSGDGIVLWVSGARPIEKKDLPRLYNVVEEMTIASGLPMPRIYIIEDTAPNAFATGRSPDRATIAVTRGLLDKLNRDELQGVVAHELAHIRNYDIRVAMLLSVMVGSIALLADGFARSMWYGGGGRRSRRDNDGGQAIFIIIGLVLAILAPIFAKLLEMAVSRRREYLADATAVLLTRNPDGLGSALLKISQDREPLEVANRATQHLYIVNPVKSWEERAQGLFDTHPPIHERVARLHEMGFRGAPEERRVEQADPAAQTPSSAAQLPVGAAGLVSGGREPTPAAFPGGAACPRCRAPLGKGTVNHRPLKGCGQCGGVWIGGADLAALLETAPDTLGAVDRRYPNRVGHGWDRVADRRCPDCGRALVQQAGGFGTVQLDRCPDCDGVWFDDGELTATVSALQQARTEQAH